ncbi:hypothetical protein [Agarilytica rhodophyticola]|uniref:hypothetical protein n=1 Tax=Agarilytica rhodophyticola TaxID=1737490 RepID=UPI000B347977|nr:hypothetical protein [Agarilytica rhodophyticola]
MVIHYQAFREELYIEHLEEAAFQYETRLSWLHDPQIGWQDLEDIDQAIEMHIDALLVGEKLGLKVCVESLADAEASTLHVIVRVFCRYRLIDRLSHLWTLFDFDDEDKVSAVADALKWECPQQWFPSLLKVFGKKRKANMFPVLVPSIAYQSRQSGEHLLTALDNAEEENLPQILWAISRCERNIQKQATTKLLPFSKHDDAQIVARAVLALMMMGDAKVLNQSHAHFTSMPMMFAIGGSIKDSEKLIALAKTDAADEQCLMALGVAGNLDAVPVLLAYLKHEELGASAAQAMQLITGAGLYEDKHEADEVEQDELFEHELEDFAKGELPKNIDGHPFGVEVRQLITKKAPWAAWLDQHKSQFTKGLRYRNGRPFSPMELVNNLIDNQSPFSLRQCAYEELVIRYGIDIPFAPDELIYRQQDCINKMYFWAQSNQQVFVDGKWYFDSKEIIS